MLQLATVKPQPHWQVRPSETCEFVGVSAANVSRETFFSSGERNTNIAATRNTTDAASVNFARTDQSPPGAASASSRADERLSAVAIAARSRTFGHITITVPSTIIRPPAHSQKTSGVRNTSKVAV